MNRYGISNIRFQIQSVYISLFYKQFIRGLRHTPFNQFDIGKPHSCFVGTYDAHCDSVLPLRHANGLVNAYTLNTGIGCQQGDVLLGEILKNSLIRGRRRVFTCNIVGVRRNKSHHSGGHKDNNSNQPVPEMMLPETGI